MRTIFLNSCYCVTRKVHFEEFELMNNGEVEFVDIEYENGDWEEGHLLFGLFEDPFPFYQKKYPECLLVIASDMEMAEYGKLSKRNW